MKAAAQGTDADCLTLRGQERVTHVPGFWLSGAAVERSVYLNAGFDSEGEANLVGAKIGGDLDCGGGQFISHGDRCALSANGAGIKGVVFLNNGFTAQGEVDLAGATIGADSRG